MIRFCSYLVAITHTCVLIAHGNCSIVTSETFAHYNTKGRCMSMTIKELKLIIESLMDDTVILIEDTDVKDVESINIEIHSDGRSHLIFSVLE